MQKTRIFFDEENFVEGIKNIAKFYKDRGHVMVVLPDENAVEMSYKRFGDIDILNFISLETFITDSKWRLEQEYKKVIIFRPDQLFEKKSLGLDIEIHVKRTMRKKEETKNEAE